MKANRLKVIVVIGGGSIGQAIARRSVQANNICLADLRKEIVMAEKVLNDARL